MDTLCFYTFLKREQFRQNSNGRYTVSSLEKFIYRCKIVRKELGRVAENRKETGLLIVNELEFCNGPVRDLCERMNYLKEERGKRGFSL